MFDWCLGTKSALNYVFLHQEKFPGKVVGFCIAELLAMWPGATHSYKDAPTNTLWCCSQAQMYRRLASGKASDVKTILNRLTGAAEKIYILAEKVDLYR